MRNLQMYISHMVFAMEILSLHWGYINIDIRTGDNCTNVRLVGCVVISQTEVWHLQACEACENAGFEFVHVRSA
jgi:hypothetical protein